jgi:hypothetical protein
MSVKVVSFQKTPVKPIKNRTSKVWGDGMFNVRTDRRSSERIPVTVPARFFCGNKVYEGKVTDISENGMFVATDMRLPKNSRIDIMILVNNKVVTIPVSVKRTVNPDIRQDMTSDSGVGVELVQVPQKYADFVKSRMMSIRN